MVEFAAVARPYAKALFNLAEEKSQSQNWYQGLAELAWLVQQPKVSNYISQSDLDCTQKAEELIRLLNDSNVIKSVEFCNFIYLVAQEKRLNVLPEIHAQYQNLLLQKNDAKEAIIYTAYDIASEGQKAKITADLQQRFNVGLQATFKIDPELIGGVKVVIGDQVLDLSVQGKLKQLYTTMTN